MKLYYLPGACSLAPHIALEETGLSHQLVPVDPKTKQFPGGDFRKVNPKGYVPALELDDGQVLTEAAVILQFLADRKPEAKLIPAPGTFERYRCQEWMNFIATEIHKGFGPLWNPASAEEAKSHAKETLKRRFGFVADHLKTHAFLLGERFSVADIYLFTIVNWAFFHKLDLSPWPELLGFMERVGSRPGVAAALRAEGLSR